MTSSVQRRLLALILMLAMLAPACFLRSVVGRVHVESLDKELDVVFAAASANATVAVCRDSPFTGLHECVYVFDGVRVTSTAELVSDTGVFGALVDPLVLQLPSDILAVTGTFNYRGFDEALDVSLVGSFAADINTTITAEPGTTFAILELPAEVRDVVAAQPEGEPLGLDYSLDIRLPRLEPLSVKPMYTIRVDVDGQTFFPPMLPCVTDFADVPMIEIPVADEPQNLLDDVGTAMDLVQPCDAATYRFEAAGPVPDDRVGRISGPDRIATAIEVSRATWPGNGQAAGVVLARANDFPDALAGSPLAWALAAPILLTGSDALDPRVAEEIRRVIPPSFDVYVLGGTAAISEGVVAEVQALGYTVFRIGGSNRFDTAVAAAEFLRTPPEIVYIADGGTFPGALLGGAAGAASNGRVLLTSGSQMSPETQAWINANPDIPRVAVGDLAVAADSGASPVVGSTAEISVTLARQVWGAGPDEVFLASDTVFADGLSAGPLTGPRNPFATYTGGPLLLTDPATLPPVVSDYLTGIGGTVERAAIVGGTAAVDDSVRAAAAAALG